MPKLHALLAVLALALFALPAAAQDEEDPAPEAPDGWTCTAGFYGSDDGCDCGCGIVDADCEDDAPDTCQYDWCPDGGDPDPADTTQCVEPEPPVEGWTCTPGYYGGGDGCDCGCGAPDTDCEDNTYESCRFNYCGDGLRPAASDPSQCEEGEWTPPDNDTGSDGSDGVDDDGLGDDDDTPTDDGLDDGAPDDGADDDGADDKAGDDGSDEPGNLGPTGGDGSADTGTDTGGSGGEADVSGGCSATPEEPAVAFLAGLLILAWRRRRR